ncbi:hypothetical protein H6P81_000897 [Aristolochia fimbriata]|uniref:Pectinesterase inhibitor domain-containing protein n=1 Tax=Aristolochia fimbriata TaxID=158543 RepID=A0AAV7F645_ARIFI|nr:hypothetical protein H6P81_000897 [Aristolochia fimbriata]
MVKSVASVLPLLFLLLSLPRSSEAHGITYIQKVCNRAVKFDNLINYDFCVNTLQAVPESHKTEIGGLLEITARLTLQNVTDTTNLIRRLSGLTCDDLLKGQLLACETQYNLAAIPLRAFSDECVSKTYLGADKLASIIDHTLECENVLLKANSAGVKASGLLSDENNNAKQLASILKALARFVTKNKQH